MEKDSFFLIFVVLISFLTSCSQGTIDPSGGSDGDGSDGDGSSGQSSMPKVDLQTPADNQRGWVSLSFSIADKEGDNCRIEVEFFDGQGWATATITGKKDALTPGDHALTWNSLKDRTGVKTSLRLKARAHDGNQYGPWSQTQDFGLDNTAWVPFPVRSREEVNKGWVGGEGLQHSQGIARSRSNPNVIYLAHDCGQIWRSSNAGESWNKTGGQGLWVLASQSIEVDPLDPDTIMVIMDNSWDYHNTDFKGIYRSTDGGQTFDHLLNQVTHNSRRYEHNIAYDPSSTTDKAQRWYAAMYDLENGNDQVLIYATENAGDHWTSKSHVSAKRAYDLKVHPNDGKTLYLGTSKGLYISHNKADSFEKITPNLDKVTSIAIDEKTPDTLLAVSSKGIYRSQNGGDNFSLLKSGSNFIHVFMNPGHPLVLFLVT
jgi:hypothetical protein